MSDAAKEDQLFGEAARWFARMRGPDAESSRAPFERWLGQGAGHRAAYNRAAEVFAMGKVLGGDEPPVPVAKRRLQRRLMAVAATLFTVFVAGGAGWVVLQAPDLRDAGGRQPLQKAAFATAVGERRQLRLADGSIVLLEPGTGITVALDRSVRRLRLERGQARFQVARQSRPFVVLAGGGSVTARGTMFDVALMPGAVVSVRLVEGVIDVRLPALAGKRAAGIRRLHGGESVTFQGTPGQGPASIDAHLAALGQAAPLRLAAQSFEEVRLADLVARANHRAEHPIRLADPALGEQRISGRFRVEDSEQLADRLALAFDLSVDRSNRSATVLRRRK